VQQAIEMALKYYVTLIGKNYVENHEIRANINVLRDAGAGSELLRKLYTEAATINSWESGSRYDEAFSVVFEDLERCIAYADELITMLSNMTSVVAESKSDNQVYDLIPEAFKQCFSSVSDCVAAWKVAHPELVNKI
jgi:HEPN domain-containing protein